VTVWVVKLLTAVLATLAIAPEAGPPPVIAVVSRSESDPVMVAALNRFRGEAAAVGFSVALVRVPIGLPPASEMEIASRGAPSVATVAFVHGDDPRGLDVWFMDRQDGRTIVDHVSVESDADDRALVVAVKAVDVLRARLYGLLARSGRTPPPWVPVPAPAPVAVAPTVTAPAAEPPSAAPAERWDSSLAFGVSLGVGALRSVQGLGTSLVLLVRGAYDLTSSSAMRITFGGLGTRPKVDSPMAGYARVRESLLMLEWALSPWARSGRRVRPLLVVDAGAHYFAAEGFAMDPFQPRDVSGLVGAAGMALGARAFLSRRLALCIEAGAMLLFPHVQVRIPGANPRGTGQPTLFANLTLETRL
jgi:hypothetical protein